LTASWWTSEPIREAFPDLYERFKLYEEGFETAGHRYYCGGLRDEIYALILSYPTAKARIDYIDEDLSFTDDPS
jgi:hypothetical protein